MCTKPLKAFKYGETSNGKDNYIIAAYSTDHIEISKNHTIQRCPDHFVSDTAKDVVFNYIEIPCGKCLECRLDHARQWADRCVLEASQYDENCFLTLTYDDLHIPTIDDVRPDTGEVVKFKTVVKKDLQDFIKRLRDRVGYKKIRYFACGEYGDQSLRPHYHLILFNYKPADLELISKSPLGDEYFQSNFIKEVWPYGNNLVADCEWNSCCYVARYVVKKYKQDSYLKETKIEQPFILMSRRPGIGQSWFNSHNNCYAGFLENYISTPDGSRKISHNRYFDNQLEKIDPLSLEKIKENRLYFMKMKKKGQYFQSDLPYFERLQVHERNLKNKTKVLERSLI